MRPTISLIAPALALALAFSSGAYAQATATPAPDSHQAKVEERIRDMYATLHITKDQDPLWNAYAQVMLDNAQDMETTIQQNGGDRNTLSAAQILDNYAAISDQHALNVAKLSGAFQVLYASFSPDQKQIADEMFRARDEKKAEQHKPTN
jgi:D-hexose-6-phosphate mutarotase